MLPPEEIGSHGKMGHHSVCMAGWLPSECFILYCIASWISLQKTKVLFMLLITLTFLKACLVFSQSCHEGKCDWH